jgi:hypothetical protein
MSNYIPKVGEKCLLTLNNLSPKEYKVLYCGKFGVFHWLMNETEHLHYMDTDVTFKPMPTEEEKMIDELTEFFDELSKSARYAIGGNELAAIELIELGYRKVEPISFDDFRDMYHTYKDFDLYKKLINKNIIVKDGE